MEDSSQDHKKTAMILLTGYLGSGKTTLISYILKSQTKYKVAVIQNEFADEMGIESPLMQDSEGKPFDKFYELPNGCICCTAKDDLLTAVEYLIKNESTPLDFILIETNGLADPSAAVKIFWVDDEAKFPGELRSIHTVVPTHRFETLRSDKIFLKQLLYADTILLNHTDKLTEEQIQVVEKDIVKLNPLASIQRTSFCNVELEKIFDIDGFNLRSSKMEAVEKINKLSAEQIQGNSQSKESHHKDCMDNCNEHDHDHHHHNHTSNDDHEHASEDIKYYFFESTEPFDYRQLEINLGELLWENETIKVLRMKGLIDIQDDEYMYSLQGVEDIFEVKKTTIKWQTADKRKSKLLFICQNTTLQEITDLVLKKSQ